MQSLRTTILPTFLSCCLVVASTTSHADELTSAASKMQPPTETAEQHEARLRWFREARFGLFIHWGVYAALAGEYHGKEVNGYGEWIMKNCEIPMAEYRGFAKDFTAAKYDPKAWAKLAKEAGMKYVVLTSKHHDGFALYDSQVSEWNAVKASGAGRNLITPLAAAVRAQGLKFGLYYSQDLDWNNVGGGILDKADWDPAHKGDFDQYLKTVSLPQVDELITRFHPDVVWWDMALHMTSQRAAPFAERIMREGNIITNNRLGGGVEGDTTTPEQEIPSRGYSGKMFEVCMTINDTWGFKTSDQNWKSPRDLLRKLTDISSKGGNFLLNVGPDREGVIPPACVERLQAIGRWMHVNGESIYATQASPFARRLPWGRVTRKATPAGGETLYLHVWDWPDDGVLILPGVEQLSAKGSVMADGAAVTSKLTNEGLVVKLPGAARDPDISVVALTFDKPVVPTRDGYPEPGKDGRISLGPDDADIVGYGSDIMVVVGKGADAHLTGWKKANARVEYQVKTPQVSVWTVSAEIAAAKPVALRLRSTLGGSLAQVPATGGPDKWQTVELGRVRLPVGVASVQLMPRSQDWSSIDLRRVWLTPSDLPAGAPVAQAASGSITLGPDDASFVNRKNAPIRLRSQSSGNTLCLGYWTQKDDSATWQAAVTKPGDFKVRCTYAVPLADAGASYTLTVGSQTLQGTFADTGSFDTYQTVDLGTITIPEPGTKSVTLSPDRMKGAFCNLRELTLVPVN